MRTRDIARVIRSERAVTLALFDDLSDEDLGREALPGWTVADVFRHLADSDRGSVRGVHLLHFLPGKDLLAFERANDRNLARLRARDRATLRRELDTWGRRLATLVRFLPQPIADLPVPTAFGKLPAGWLAALRIYDEWVHRWDVHRVLGRDDPAMTGEVRRILAWFQVAAVEADAAGRAAPSHGSVRIVLDDVDSGPWLVRLASADLEDGTDGRADATVTTDVPTWSLVAADRVPWRALRDQGRIRVEGDGPVAHALLDAVRVV